MQRKEYDREKEGEKRREREMMAERHKRVSGQTVESEKEQTCREMEEKA